VQLAGESYDIPKKVLIANATKHQSASGDGVINVSRPGYRPLTIADKSNCCAVRKRFLNEVGGRGQYLPVNHKVEWDIKSQRLRIRCCCRAKRHSQSKKHSK
jgi:hypothetical protein